MGDTTGWGGLCHWYCWVLDACPKLPGCVWTCFVCITECADSALLRRLPIRPQVCCGSRHTVLLTEAGEVLTCGWGKWQQLARDGDSAALGVVPLQGGRALAIHAGGWLTLIAVQRQQAGSEAGMAG